MKQVLSMGKRSEKILGSCVIKSQTQSTCKMYRKMDKGTNAGIPISPFCFIVVKMKHTYEKGLMEDYSIIEVLGDVLLFCLLYQPT